MTAVAPLAFDPRFLERCSACPGVLPAEGVRVCPSCGKVKVTPRYQDWPIHLQGFLTVKSVERRFIEGVPPQKTWEDLLVMVVAGQQYEGKLYRWATIPDECYTVVLKAADAWLAAGKPIPFLTN